MPIVYLGRSLFGIGTALTSELALRLPDTFAGVREKKYLRAVLNATTIDIPIGFFAILLSIFTIKNSPIRFTTKAFAGDQFYKTKIPPAHSFFARCLGNLRANFKAIRQILVSYKLL